MSDDKDTNEEVVLNETGYKAKNAELLNKLAKANKDKDALEKRLEALEDAAEEAKGTSTELTKAQKAQLKAETELARVNALLEAQGTRLRSVVLANEIDKAMDANNVLPHMREPLRALFMRDVEWDAEEQTGSISGKAVADHLSSYFKSKSAAHYVAAPETGGAGAEGNTTAKAASSAATLFPDLANVNLGEWGKYASANREEANAYAISKGHPELAL